MSKKAEALMLSEEDYWKLRRIVESKGVLERVRIRARVLLGAAEGLSNHELASRFSVSRPTVMKWRKHYAEQGLEGLLIPRAPSAFDRRDALRKEIEIVNMSFGSRPPWPPIALWWTVHGLARHLHVSRDTIGRVWREYGITRRVLWGRGYPDLVIISPDPLFGSRISAVVGLYWHGADRALAFAVDPQRSSLRWGADGDPDKCPEIDALRAALKSLDAVTMGSGQEPAAFLKYLERLEEKVPAEQDIHLVMRWYGYGVHQDPAVQEWLAAHPRFLPRFIPRINWINYVECWLDLVQAAGRGEPLDGAKEMVPFIEQFVRHAQENPGAGRGFCVAL